MKNRMLAVCLMLMILLCCGASAETFVIRNGLTWGMSPEEVTAIEGKEDLASTVENGLQTYHFFSRIAEQLKDIEGVEDFKGDINDFSAYMKWHKKVRGYAASVVCCFEDHQLVMVIYNGAEWKPEIKEIVINKLNEQCGAYSEAETEDLRALMAFLDPRSDTCGFITDVKYWHASGTDIWCFDSLGSPLLVYVDSTYGQPAAEVYDLTGL